MTADQPIDVRDMAIVHQTFRRSYEESAALVRANPTPSAHRVQFLADHIDFGVSLLHHHHGGEDELLYPLLLERAPDKAANTEHIEHEHQEVAAHIDAVSAACAAWRGARRPRPARPSRSRSTTSTPGFSSTSTTRSATSCRSPL